MSSSEDEGETFPDAVSDYYFNDKDDEPLSFSKLPVQWNDNESSSADLPIFLRGKVDNGLGRLYQQVKAWKFDISTSIPEILVLSKDDHWIKLKKPRKSYEELIRSILISVHCLWFCKSKPEASGKSLRDYLSKVFSLYDPRPSENDLLDHINFIRESIKRDETLAKSKAMSKFIPQEMDIKFEHQVDDDDEDDEDEVRAWDGLLPKSRALIYCVAHEIDPELGTPARTTIFRNILNRSTEKPYKKKLAVKVTGSDSVDLSKKKAVLKSQKGVERSSAIKPEGSSKKRAAVSSGPESLKKKKVADARSLSTKVKKPSPNDAKPQQTEILPPLDDESKQRIMALMKEAASSVTLDEVKKYHQAKVPSTHAHSSRVDKSIILARVEGYVEALNLALKKLEEGCSVEDAMAVCNPNVIDQLLKWKDDIFHSKVAFVCKAHGALRASKDEKYNKTVKAGMKRDKLKVYLAPFLHGMRYTSFGRHFTKVEKLEKIVDKLHWYVEDGDTIVDFCCGANDFSCLMKKRLDEMGKKKCSYINFDIARPKNDFNFKKKDWMTVSPKELPSGSRLIMGLNPPFGRNAALANKFIANALKFNPKLIILIVPPETERLDSSKRSPPYDLIWEDVELLAGKSFYLPGSVDVNDKIMDQWNNIAPPLYLWSRPGWTNKHRAIARKHGHIPQQQPQSDENETKSGLTAGKVEIEDGLPDENGTKSSLTYKAKKPKNKKRKKESPDGPETKSKPIIKEEKGNQSSSKKTRHNEEVKTEEHEDQAQRLEEARAPVEAQKHENIRAPVEAQKRELPQAPTEAQKHENIRAPVEAQKRSITSQAPVEVPKNKVTRAPVEAQKHQTQAPVEAQKHEVIRVPSREIDVQKHEETLVPTRELEPRKHEKYRAREIEDMKPMATCREIEALKHEKSWASSRETEDQKPRATSREIEAPKHEKARAPSRETEAQKHEKARVLSREFEDQKPRATYRETETQKTEKPRVPYREIEDPKPRATYREIESQKHDKTRAPSREMETHKQEKPWGLYRESESQKYENKRPSPHTREDKVNDILNADFSFVDADQPSEGRYDSVIDESTFSLENDLGQSYDEFLARKFRSANEEPYMGSASHRRLDNASHAAPGYSMRSDHLQYPPGYDRVVNRGPYFEETGARGGGGYSMARHEPGLTRYGSSDATPYNRTSTSATQRYAPRLDELNHVRANNLGRSELDEMNHMRMGGLGRPEQPMGSRGVGGYHPSINGPGGRMDPMGFAPGPYHPY
ncbi:hypothetical protein M8C21_031286 [Ambrosia artemisiifolia]|uniref:Protein ENHANCED DOWNY MILDEW 2 n=1 Tax=Ambrosia artemisiifolia TaxID=4212 RepID=A0AAD5G683_AMBAR|nr:hypothetical protein M8C21_031286 [Ambrosia artemisiifolia]